MEHAPILHIAFPSQYLMADALMRFSEHYESPVLAGKSFTREECMDEYARRKGEFTFLAYRHDGGELPHHARRKANFTYHADWLGFNVPSEAFRAFYGGQFEPLTRKERALLEALRPWEGAFYLIATCPEADPDVFCHEVMHGLFGTIPEYALSVYDVLRRHPESVATLVAQLARRGYAPKAMADEINAYGTTDWMFGTAEEDKRAFAGLQDDLIANAERHFRLELRAATARQSLERMVTEVPFADVARHLMGS